MSEKSPSTPSVSRKVFILVAVVYLGAAVLAGWKVIAHTKASTDQIEKILNLYNLKNEGAQTLDSFKKAHPFLGMFISSPIRHQLGLATDAQSNDALYSEVVHYQKAVLHESFVAAWWSWCLLNISLFYIVLVIALKRSFTARSVLFSLTLISVAFFVIGILAPAMVIWTAPTIPLESGKLEFVVQHEIRGIAAIIWELLTSGHWIIGGFLLLFSIVTPLTKASLTFLVTATKSEKRNRLIGEILHTIGKWSMADVFVAAVLLALYALKFQEATRSIACLGLYYFVGYCLLSLSTTELLVHSRAVGYQREGKSPGRLGGGIVAVLFAVLLCFTAGSSVYTYQQYTENTKQKIKAADAPHKLDNSVLVLPVHK